MPKAKDFAPPMGLSDMLAITIPLEHFDFSPETEEDEKAKKLREVSYEKIPNLLEWTRKKRPLLIPGREFDIEGHKYLVDLYNCQEKEIVVKKSGQAGVSEWLISYAIHACDQRMANVLYIFPTEGTVSDFSTARLGPAVEASEYLTQIIVTGSGSGGSKGSDRIGLKRFRDRFMYLRGSLVEPDGSAPKLKSVDAEVLILDEVDELDQRCPPIARKRLGHARASLGNVLWVSTPTFPGYGIDAEFTDSDQRNWMIPCPHCGHRQPLTIDQVVLEWDEIGRPLIWNGQADNRVWIGCENCGKELDRLADGEWVAKYPNNERAGFHISKLFSPHNRLIDTVKNLDTADETKRREAFNQDLGETYTPRGGNLTAEIIDACRRDYGHGPDRFHTCCMGIDVGAVLHVVVRTMPNFLNKETKQVYAGEATWESIHNLVTIYNPRTIVIDANPEASKAREFQEKYQYNRVWVAYYPNQPLGTKHIEMLDWDVVQRKVVLDRTRIMDTMFAGFYGGKSTLPAHARNIRDYYKQMRANIRVMKEVGHTGIEVATYIDNNVPDHYGMAEVYCLAAQLCKIGMGWVEPPGA